MNFGVIRSVLGKILILVAALMGIPLLVSLIYQEGVYNALAFVIPMIFLAITGALLTFIKPKKKKILAKEGFIIVGLSWIIMSLVGAIPFIVAPSLDPNVEKIDYITAVFEIASGFSTTGSTNLTAIQLDSMCHSLLFWRSFSHWIGGMGVLVFILALIPESDEGSAMHILRAESPGPQVGKLVSKMRVTSRILYIIYIVLTLLEFIILICLPSSYSGAMWGNNGTLAGANGHDTIFNALCLTFGTAGTGGFTPFSCGCIALSADAQYVIATFMIIFGVNFSIYYFLLIGNFKEIFRNEELRTYLIIVFVCVTLICINTYSLYNNFEETFRHSLFQVASIISTTGYASYDYVGSTSTAWPTLSIGIIVILTIIGACAGSTAGGMKISRVIIVNKATVSKVKAYVTPRKIETIRLDGKPINETTVNQVTSYMVIYAVILLVGALLVSIYNLDSNLTFLDCITASLTCLSNVGPGLGNIGPTGNFAGFSNFSKIVLSFLMIAGRLELIPILVLFAPSTWKK